MNSLANNFRTALAAAGWLALACAAGSQAKADTTYSYTGPYFNSFTPSSGTPFNTSDRITGTFTLSSTLAANHALASVIPNLVSFSFFDGIDTMVYNQGGTSYLNGSANTVNVLNFKLGTNSSGVITSYFVNFYVASPQANFFMSNGWDEAYTVGDYRADAFGSSAAIAPATAATPEPSAMFLLAPSLVGLAVWARKRARPIA